MSPRNLFSNYKSLKLLLLFVTVLLAYSGINIALQSYDIDDDNSFMLLTSEGLFDEDVRNAFYQAAPYAQQIQDKYKGQPYDSHAVHYYGRFFPDLFYMYYGISLIRNGISTVYKTINPFDPGIKVRYLTNNYFYQLLGTIVFLWTITLTGLNAVKDKKVFIAALFTIIIMLWINYLGGITEHAQEYFLPFTGVDPSTFNEIWRMFLNPGMRFHMFGYEGRSLMPLFLFAVYALRIGGNTQFSYYILAVTPLLHISQGPPFLLGIIAMDFLFVKDSPIWKTKNIIMMISSPFLAIFFAYKSPLILLAAAIIIGALLLIKNKPSLIDKWHELISPLKLSSSIILRELFFVLSISAVAWVGSYMLILMFNDIHIQFRASQLPVRFTTSYRPVYVLFICAAIVQAARYYFNNKQVDKVIYALFFVSAFTTLAVAKGHLVSLEDYEQRLQERANRLHHRAMEKKSIAEIKIVDSGEMAVWIFDACLGKHGWFINKSWLKPKNIIPKFNDYSSEHGKIYGSGNNDEHFSWHTADHNRGYWVDNSLPTIENPAILEITLSKAINLSGYSIRTRDRDRPSAPSEWKLLASNDKANWVQLDKRIDEFKFDPTRYQLGFKVINNEQNYRHYKFVITGTRNLTNKDVSIDEVEFYSEDLSAFNWFFK